MSDKAPDSLRIRIDPKLHKRLVDVCEKVRLDKSEVLRSLAGAYANYIESTGKDPFKIPPKLTLNTAEHINTSEQEKFTANQHEEILKAAERIAEETVRKLMKGKTQT